MTSRKHGPMVNTTKDYLSENTSQPVTEIFVQTIKKKWRQMFMLESSFFLPFFHPCSWIWEFALGVFNGQIPDLPWEQSPSRASRPSGPEAAEQRQQRQHQTEAKQGQTVTTWQVGGEGAFHWSQSLPLPQCQQKREVFLWAHWLPWRRGNCEGLFVNTLVRSGHALLFWKS